MILDNKRNLRGRKKGIFEDWTCKERKMRWRLENIARSEERKGLRVRMGYGNVRIGEQWWKWDEEEEVLRRMGRGI